MLRFLGKRIHGFWTHWSASLLSTTFRSNQRRDRRERRLTTHAGQLEDRTLLASIVVTSLADNMADDGLTTLREAIQAANSTFEFDEISFAPSLVGSLNLLLGEMVISKPLRITGNGATATIIDAQQLSRIFEISGFSTGDVTLEKLTLTRGRTTHADFAGFGGAIRSTARDLFLNDCIVKNNSTTGGKANGGAIHASGNVTLNGCVLSGNSTSGLEARGGGIQANSVSASQSTLTKNFTSNDRAYGGAVFIEDSSRAVAVSMSQCTVSENWTDGAESSGGAIYVLSAGISIQDSTLFGNSAKGTGGSGGAIYARGGPVKISQSTVSGNSTRGTQGDGGAIYTFTGAVSISQSTLTQNRSEFGKGGAIFAFSSAVSVDNSIIANNNSGGLGNAAAPDINLHNMQSMIARNSMIGDNRGTGLDATGLTPGANGNFVGGSSSSGNSFNPYLGPLRDNGGPTFTHALLPESLAINHGRNALAVDVTQGGSTPALTTDQRGTGFARIKGGIVDMGAFESTFMEAVDDVLSDVAEDSGARTISFASLLVNDTDADLDTLTISSVSNAVGGVVSIVGTDVIFTPTLNYNGPASFDYTVSDGSLIANWWASLTR